jgi:hypothetical protein
LWVVASLALAGAFRCGPRIEPNTPALSTLVAAETRGLPGAFALVPPSDVQAVGGRFSFGWAIDCPELGSLLGYAEWPFSSWLEIEIAAAKSAG